MKRDSNTFPKVSICCVTYNHEKFIAQALDSFLCQQTNFPFEILIHDDASIDQTPLIIKDYQTRFPEIIKPILRIENIKSKLGGGVNIKFNVGRSEAKYIAICQGDDYWTDPLKLQKQVDFLESNQDFVLCAGNSQIERNGHLLDQTYCHWEKDMVFDPKDIIESFYAPNLSILFLRESLEDLDFFSGVIAGDRFLYFLLSPKGKFKYFNEIYGVYRKHEDGVSELMTKDFSQQLKWESNSNVAFHKILPYLLNSQKSAMHNMIYCSDLKINGYKYRLGQLSRVQLFSKLFILIFSPYFFRRQNFKIFSRIIRLRRIKN